MSTTTVNTENKQIEQIVSLATLDEQSVYSNLNSTRQGLSSEQYHSNALNFGTNIIPNKESRRMSRIILEAFFSPFNILLIMVAVFDAIVNYFSSTEKQSVFGIVLSFLVVVILIIVAAIIKIVFEIKAKRINAQLYSNIETHHLVMRDQKEILVSCNDIVVGDVVRLKIGDIAPADLRVIENCDLAITQATLTGESHSLTKTTTFDNTDISTITNDILHVPNIIYRGSSIVAGTGLGIVFATGTNSFVGQMTNHINAKPHRTYFENGIRKLTVSLSILIIVSCVILFLMKTIFARTIHADWPIAIIESLVFTFGLTVNLAPKTLPTLLNINLSSNANKLYKQQLITKSINRVQSFGAADIICLDKTGTLTENKISVNDFINVNGKRDKSVLLAAFLNSHFQNSWKNNIDTSIIQTGEAEKLESELDKYKLINEIPFDFQRRIMSVVLRHQNQSMIYSKGSLEEILAISSTYVENGKIKKITKTVIDKIMASADVYNDCGMRILGVAQKVYKNVSSKQEINKTDEKQMQFLGFVVLFDLPRFSSKQTIQDLITHGIEPKILTGDNIAVTKHLCQTLGLHVKGILSGSEMDRMSNEELKNVLNFVTVFVKLTPIHKERIIQTLREQGHVVGFVGDGTNDALAMHASDFSVALCNATDIAKQNVDFVMKNDDISVIVKAAIAGRVAHVNIMKYIKLALTQSVNWIIITLIASFWFAWVPGFKSDHGTITSQGNATLMLVANTLIFGLTNLLVPWDNVDPEDLAKPVRFNLKSMPRFVIFFGTIICLFDITVFLIMIYGFGIPTANGQDDHTILLFQTVWVMENIIIQGLIIMLLRTRKIAFIQSKPGKIPFNGFIFSSLGFIGWMFLPISTSWYQSMSLPPSPLSKFEGLYLLIFLVAIWAAAVVVIEFAKHIYVKIYKDFL